MHKVNIDPWFVQKAKQTRDGRLHAYDTLEARKTALVVVDMQNYCLRLGGAKPPPLGGSFSRFCVDWGT